MPFTKLPLGVSIKLKLPELSVCIILFVAGAVVVKVNV